MWISAYTCYLYLNFCLILLNEYVFMVMFTSTSFDVYNCYIDCKDFVSVTLYLGLGIWGSCVNFNMADRSKRYKKIGFLGEGQVRFLLHFREHFSVS